MSLNTSDERQVYSDESIKKGKREGGAQELMKAVQKLNGMVYPKLLESMR